MTRHLGLQYIPERHTMWRSIVAFWGTALWIAFLIITIMGAVVVEALLVIASFYLGASIHPLLGILFVLATVFFTLPLAFFAATNVTDRVLERLDL